ncbi:hypothetical protein QAD02_000023 [Eretmocerus hayati]|uniref:Uncharacterized protein n=1 Tax=Eretmocerus hayati TaxID=131215 RepID=A0ACC2NEK9_9HYME|nr:hypothetical protein QAD02_000023 [Eretmocerus hayati]
MVSVNFEHDELLYYVEGIFARQPHRDAARVEAGNRYGGDEEYAALAQHVEDIFADEADLVEERRELLVDDEYEARLALYVEQMFIGQNENGIPREQQMENEEYGNLLRHVQGLFEEDPLHAHEGGAVDHQNNNDLMNEERRRRDRRREQFKRDKELKAFLREYADALNMEPEKFRKLYRITPDMARELIRLLRPTLELYTRTSISIECQVLITVRFLAEGGFQKGVGQDINHPVSQTLVSQILGRVIAAINGIRENYIFLPSTPEQRRRTQRQFVPSIRIPGVCLIMDGFLVRFLRPPAFEEAFFNFHEQTSVNVQMICDALGYIRSLAVHPGSNNDGFAWENSEAREVIEGWRADDEILEEEGLFYVLADNGYDPSQVVLTPMEGTIEGTPEGEYTRDICRNRSIVERTIRGLTGVWMVINRGRKLWYRPEKVTQIIYACAVLHNFRKMHGLHDADWGDFGEIIEPADAVVENELDANYMAGLAERNFIINAFYRD